MSSSRTSGQESQVLEFDPVSGEAGSGLLAMSTVETTHSTLFFLADRVYKMPKRMVSGPTDLRRRAAREAACRAEVVRNQPFAPGVYLGVADVSDDAGQPVEHMIVMRRLPADRRLSELIARGEPVDGPLREVARALVTFHEQCAVPARGGGHSSLPDLEAAWLTAVDGLTPLSGSMLNADEIEQIAELGQRYLRGRGTLIDARAARGRIRDGHGNLVAEHVFCLPEGPRILDRLSADGGRRVADVLSDAATLAVDLELRGVPALADRFFHWCAEFSGESHPPSLAHFYLAYRAVARAGESGVRAHLGDEPAAAEARRLTRIALEHLRRARVRLVLVGGAPGTLRSAVAERLATDVDGWVLLASDVIRAELAVDRERQPAGAAPREFGSDESVYAEILRRAREALENGDSVVAEARWPSAARAAGAQVAAGTWADLIELDCREAGASFDGVVRNGRLAAGITA